jgi:hypothetical protein
MSSLGSTWAQVEINFPVGSRSLSSMLDVRQRSPAGLGTESNLKRSLAYTAFSNAK